jgi:hypothetical protein
VLLCDVTHHLDLFEKAPPALGRGRPAIAVVFHEQLAARRQRASRAPSIAETRYVDDEPVLDFHAPSWREDSTFHSRAQNLT